MAGGRHDRSRAGPGGTIPWRLLDAAPFPCAPAVTVRHQKVEVAAGRLGNAAGLAVTSIALSAACETGVTGRLPLQRPLLAPAALRDSRQGTHPFPSLSPLVRAAATPLESPCRGRGAPISSTPRAQAPRPSQRSASRLGPDGLPHPARPGRGPRPHRRRVPGVPRARQDPRRARQHAAEEGRPPLRDLSRRYGRDLPPGGPATRRRADVRGLRPRWATRAPGTTRSP